MIYFILAVATALTGGYTDIRKGQVENRMLVISFLAWAIIISADTIYNKAFPFPVAQMALNVAFSVGIALYFYLTDIWAPGDCKLFMLITLIFPYYAYTVREGNVFPALDIVVYSFAAGYIVLIIKYFIRREKNNGLIIETDSRLFNIRTAISIVNNMGIMSSFCTLVNTIAPVFFYSNQVLCILLAVGVISFLQKKADTLRRYIGYAGFIFFIVQTYINKTWFFSLISIMESVLIATVIEIINSQARKHTYIQISGSEVKPGIILSQSSIFAMQNCIDPNLPRITTENRRSRLNEKQAAAVATWCKNAHSNVVIIEMIPFAPFIALAVLIQILRYALLS